MALFSWIGSISIDRFTTWHALFLLILNIVKITKLQDRGSHLPAWFSIRVRFILIALLSCTKDIWWSGEWTKYSREMQTSMISPTNVLCKICTSQLTNPYTFVFPTWLFDEGIVIHTLKPKRAVVSPYYTVLCIQTDGMTNRGSARRLELIKWPFRERKKMGADNSSLFDIIQDHVTCLNLIIGVEKTPKVINGF